MTEGAYYLKLGGKAEGPYTIGQIYDLWAARKINSQTLFARVDETEKWQPLAELTLTIAPPRAGIPKTPVSEPAPTFPAKPRPTPSLRPEEYMPSFPQKSGRLARVPRGYGNFVRVLLRRSTLPLELSIGLCIAVGVVLALYFMVFLPASTDGNEVNQERLFMKQNGVIAGIGLVLMGGLLIVARQIKLLLASQKTTVPDKSERKLPQTHS